MWVKHRYWDVGGWGRELVELVTINNCNQNTQFGTSSN